MAEHTGEEALSSMYEVFYLDIQDKDAGRVIAVLCTVDVDDSRDDWDLIQTYACQTDEDIAVAAVLEFGPFSAASGIAYFDDQKIITMENSSEMSM